MALSSKTIHNLTSALKDEVIDYIHKDERYAEFMMEMIPDAITKTLGEIDGDVLYELSFCVMDSICLR